MLEELGDVLLNVIMQAEIAHESGRFDIEAVCKDINEKLIVGIPTCSNGMNLRKRRSAGTQALGGNKSTEKKTVPRSRTTLRSNPNRPACLLYFSPKRLTNKSKKRGCITAKNYLRQKSGNSPMHPRQNWEKHSLRLQQPVASADSIPNSFPGNTRQICAASSPEKLSDSNACRGSSPTILPHLSPRLFCGRNHSLRWRSGLTRAAVVSNSASAKTAGFCSLTLRASHNVKSSAFSRRNNNGCKPSPIVTCQRHHLLIHSCVTTCLTTRTSPSTGSKNPSDFRQSPVCSKRRKMPSFSIPVITDAQLIRKLQILAKEPLSRHLLKLAAEVGVKVASIHIRDQRSRWGSCSGRKSISLNWRLILMPHALQRHILLHELAHIPHPNHSKRFWDCLQEWDPDTSLHRETLRKHGSRWIALGRDPVLG